MPPVPFLCNIYHNCNRLLLIVWLWTPVFYWLSSTWHNSWYSLGCSIKFLLNYLPVQRQSPSSYSPLQDEETEAQGGHLTYPNYTTGKGRSWDLNSGLWMPMALLCPLGSSFVWTDHKCTHSPLPLQPFFWVAPTRKLLKTRLAFYLLGHFWAGAQFTWRCLPKLPWNTDRGMWYRLISKLPA